MDTITSTITSAIINYLHHHGSMSLRDICADLRVDELDVEVAAGEMTGPWEADPQSAPVRRVSPLPGGTGAWYDLRRPAAADFE